MGFQPNEFPRAQRIVYFLLSLFILGYGLVSWWRDDFYLPGRRRDIHLHGTPALLLFLASLCAAASMLSVIVDHYDKRDNEWWYRVFGRTTQILAWSCFAAGLALDVYLKYFKAS